MTWAGAAAPLLASASLLGAAAPSAALAQPQALPAGVVAAAERPAAYPHFADVPATPKDVRSAADWRKAVVATRQAGRKMVRIADAGPWTLADSEAFADRARAEAAPPAPVTTPTSPSDEAMVNALKARAIPPPRAR